MMLSLKEKSKKNSAARRADGGKKSKASTPKEHSLRFLVVIVEHGRADEIERILNEFDVKFHIVCQGEGTASNAILQLLNLDKSTKDVIINVLETAKAAEVLRGIYNSYEGSGIAFTIRLSSIGGMKALQLIRGDLNVLRNISGGNTESEGKE